MKSKANFVLKIVGAGLALASLICLVIAFRKDFGRCCGQVRAALDKKCRRKQTGDAE